jgi:hypothetical protein
LIDDCFCGISFTLKIQLINMSTLVQNKLFNGNIFGYNYYEFLEIFKNIFIYIFREIGIKNKTLADWLNQPSPNRPPSSLSQRHAGPTHGSSPSSRRRARCARPRHRRAPVVPSRPSHPG